jgi:hypothetical protein
VLEHLEDDVAALHSWSRCLGQGGLLLLSVPAFQRRFGRGDEFVGHFRRYDPERLALQAELADLQVLSMWTYGFPLGLVLEWVRNSLAVVSEAQGGMRERTERSARWHQPAGIAGPIVTAGVLPWRLLQRPFHSSRVGHGLVLLACRSGDQPVVPELADLPRGLVLRTHDT